MSGLGQQKLLNRRSKSYVPTNQAGFSLIEIIIVLGILGTLIAVLLTNLGSGTESAKKKETTVKAGQLQAQFLRYQTDMGSMPTTSEGTNVLTANPGSAKWTGPYVQADDLNDAWGSPFEYELTSKGPKLTSPGSDKSLGTEDDMIYVAGRLQETESAEPKKEE